MMRKIVPFASVVVTLRSPSSAAPSLLTGKPSVVQTLTDVAPRRPDETFLHTSSILTIALPFASWPVITRRTCSAMSRPPWCRIPTSAHQRAAGRMIDRSLNQCCADVAGGRSGRCAGICYALSSGHDDHVAGLQEGGGRLDVGGRLGIVVDEN